MMVFSLKPALTSLTTDAFVSVFCDWLLVWANAAGERIKARETVKRTRTANDFMLSPYFLRLLIVVEPGRRSLPGACGRQCRTVCRSSSRIREFPGRAERFARTSSRRLPRHYNSRAPDQPGH